MFNLEARIQNLERILADLARRFTDLLRAVQRLKDQQWAGTGAPSSGGGAAGIYFADGLNIAAASGALVGPPTIHSTSADVYQITGGGAALFAASQTIYNGLPDATDNTRRQILQRNNDGTFSVVSQSCTAY
jgi:hypothetical protein